MEGYENGKGHVSSEGKSEKDEERNARAGGRRSAVRWPPRRCLSSRWAPAKSGALLPLGSARDVTIDLRKPRHPCEETLRILRRLLELNRSWSLSIPPVSAGLLGRGQTQAPADSNPPSSDGASGLEDAEAGGSKEWDRSDKPCNPRAPGTFLLQQGEFRCENLSASLALAYRRLYF